MCAKKINYCSVDGCGNRVLSNGLCNKHFLRLKRNGSVDVVKRRSKNTIDDFWIFVEKTDSCWNWSGCLTPHGYGSFNLDGNHGAHRVSYAIHNGAIPSGMYVLHHCDNRKCVNPSHLFIGTCDDNLKDMAHKQRHGVSKLDKHKANAIKDLYATGCYTQRQLARMFGIAQSTLRLVLIGKTWKHSRYDHVGF